MLGLVLLAGLVIVATTGLLSYAAYEPRLPGNDTTPTKGLLGFYLFDWPTDPVWMYRLTQGAHVIGGIATVPLLLAKLWSVIPKLFVWPPARSIAEAVERASLVLLVGGAGFQFATGILNIQLFYVFPFSFYPAHSYGAWIFLAALVVGVGFAAWFVGAVVLHDLVLFPLYSAVDAATQALTRRARPHRTRQPAVINHLRVPAALSGLLLLVWFPLILGGAERNYRWAVGLSTSPYLARWLLITLVLFGVSGLLYVLRRRRSRRTVR